MQYIFKALFIVTIPFLTITCSQDEDYEGPEISLNKNELFLEIGKSERLIASFNPIDAPNRAHTWSSNNTQIATVDETGNVRGIEVGKAIIAAKALDGGKIATCNVTIVDKIIPVTSISVEQKELEIVEGETQKLSVTINPSNASNKNVKWKSKDETIATVDDEGNVHALSIGETEITATTVDGEKTSSCKISVIAKGIKFTLSEVDYVTSNSAIITGTIIAAGVEISERGLCFATTQNPTIEHSKTIVNGESVYSVLKDLTPETTFYVRLYAIVDGVVKYSNQILFETLTAVKLMAPTFKDIMSHSAVIVGSINSNGSDLTESGIVYSTHPLSTVNDNKICISDENIEYTLFELESNTTYYVRLYSIIGDKVYYGEEAILETNEELVTHFEATDVYEDRLVLKSKVPKGYTTVHVCYGTKSNPTVTDNISKATIQNGNLQLVLTGLSSNKTYYLRSYYKQGNQFIYSDDEVELNTIGKKNIWSSNHSSTICRIGSDYSNNLSFETKISINTILDGEFYFKAKKDNLYISKHPTLTRLNKVKEIYFAGNTELIFQITSSDYFLGGSRTYNPVDYEILHIPTGVSYYIKIPSQEQTYDLTKIPYQGYDK